MNDLKFRFRRALLALFRGAISGPARAILTKQNFARKTITPVGVLLFFCTANAFAQTYTVLTNFSGTNGSQPMGGLAISGNALYGTTYSGGSSNLGTLFKL